MFLTSYNPPELSIVLSRRMQSSELACPRLVQAQSDLQRLYRE